MERRRAGEAASFARILSGLSRSVSPDAIVSAGETNGVPSLPTSGAYTVDEAYVEARIPVLSGLPAVQQFDLSVALRFSDYSTFGNTTNGKVGFRWQMVSESRQEIELLLEDTGALMAAEGDG